LDLVEHAGYIDDGDRHPWEIARLEVVKGLIARHVRLTSRAQVLDVGCGDGFVATALARQFPGINVYGVDTSLTESLILAYRARYAGVDVKLSRTLDEAAADLSAPAALILLTDVLEHIDADEAFLRGLRASGVVSHDTRVLATVPAYQSLFSSHDRFLRHYRRYSKRTLVDTLARAGWSILESGYFFLTLLPIRWAQLVHERLFGAPSSRGLMTRAHGGPVRSFLAQTLLADARCAIALQRLGIPVPGLSVYAICRPSP